MKISSQYHRCTIFLAGFALASLTLSGCKPIEPVTFHGADVTGADYGRDFRLSDSNGRQRALADFKGKAVMLFFGFTQCPDVCPTALSRAVEIKRLLGDDGKRFQVLFVTLDPERDIPDVLRSYTAAFDPTFTGLFTDLQRTEETAKEFKIYYKKVATGSSYTMDHTALSYVYDQSGKLRLVMRHEQSAQECADDLRRILDEV